MLKHKLKKRIVFEKMSIKNGNVKKKLNAENKLLKSAVKETNI